MGENLYSKGQKVLTQEGRDNWDRIFGKPEKYRSTVEDLNNYGKLPSVKKYIPSFGHLSYTINFGINDAVRCENIGDDNAGEI